jgi:long-chain acyl-CoA synthetase
MTAIAQGTEARAWTAFYDPGVPETIEVPELTLDGLVRRAADRWPDGAALSFFGRVTSFAALDAQVDRFAHALHALGMVPGDRVSLHLPTCPAFVVALYGTLRAGAIAVPMNPLYVVREIAELAGLTRPRASVSLDLVEPRVRAARAEAGLTGPVIVVGIREQLPGLLGLLYPLKARREGRWHPVDDTSATPHLRRLVAQAASGRFDAPGGPDDVALLQATGGTTGTPKAAMLTHRNLVANAVQARAWFPRSEPGEGILAALPYFHSYGMTVAMNLSILLGARQILLPRPEAGDALRAIAREKPRMFPGVPALYQAITAHPHVDRFDLSSIDACISGAAPLPGAVQERFESVTGGRVVEGYGLTEASPVTHCNPIYGSRRFGTIGVPFPSTDAIVVSLDDGRLLPPGEEGELLVRGPQVMRGYFENQAETELVLRDGWLHTGDIAVMDADGFFRIVDRKKDLIIVGGINVWPREVEEVLHTHPLVADAAVIGVPHERLGEVPKAYVVPRKDAFLTVESVIEHCRANLAGHKVPRQVEFRAELPKTLVGKTLRRKLAEGGDAPAGTGTAGTRAAGTGAAAH